MSKKEAAVISIMILIITLGLGLFGEIKLSTKTTIKLEDISLNQKVWDDGMGTSIDISYISTDTIEGYEEWNDLVQNYTFFWVKVKQKEGPTFLMVDLDYDRMKLYDDSGQTYRLSNRELAASVGDQKLNTLLNTYHWTMFNQAFPGGDSLAKEELVWDGILAFEPLKNDKNSLTLELVYCMSGQKSQKIVCNFE